jgi:hypothetical protein
MADSSRRLSTLEGFAPAGAPLAPAEPARRTRPRILFENLDAIGLDELPDVAHELRTLRRILDLNKRLARCEGEEALYDTFLDGALSLAAAERVFLVGPGDGDAIVVLRSRDLGGVPVAGSDGEIVAAVARRVLSGSASEIAQDLKSSAVRSAVCVPFQSDRRLALWLAREPPRGERLLGGRRGSARCLRGPGGSRPRADPPPRAEPAAA